jgi:hypothetical protein
MSATTTMKAASARWESIKPKVIYLAIGLIAGPIITNMAGWQVTSGSAHDQVRASVVEQQALFCEAKARADVADPKKLEWSARSDLAKKWAAMPGTTTTDSDVVSACAGKLAS